MIRASLAICFLGVCMLSLGACSDDKTTSPAPTITSVTDIDGNSYPVVQIGDRFWTAANLKVTHYRNGDSIPNVTVNALWSGLASGAYGNYDNDTANGTTYGRLYNWFAVNDPRGLAPAGWHVASDSEWQAAADLLGGDAVAGGKLQETGTAHWAAPNTQATNESGMSVLPGGQRYGGNGNYFELGTLADFWTSTELDATYAWNRQIEANDAAIYRSSNNGKENGFSVRCVKD